MAGQRKTKPKFGVVTLVIALALAVYYNYNITDTKPPVEKYPTEAPAKKERKAKKPKRTEDLRDLTVFTGKVIGIKDGDTFEVLYDGQPERVRLADIDCPEKSQPFGNNAKQYASDLCFGETVTVSCAKKRDRYGRLIGTVTTADGTNVNEALVKAGFAWHYLAYSDKEEYTTYEATARTKQLGLWADKDPTPPWDWRRTKRSAK
jgi:endonuclease YncB( thermonuclease family)